ncbi:PAS domain S-box protein [Kamptonema sp. UHCC 0994]|uniref:PAS domain S-box protein n=1 Tax=Kamptonema sp. UHCC 0994 TaxID=3031329 RepID=UPI0023B88E46|nr:PAS domain S-box protein [Kamptonema sp. UHCC 0994]MDF0554286.1 PAS domain S-box protein [Kamptonema sp. UHCC 0994]
MVSNQQFSQLNDIADVNFYLAQRSQVQEPQTQRKPPLASDIYQNVVELQTELVSRFLGDGTLTFVNRAYCRYFGKTRRELIGTNFLLLIPEVEREEVKQQFLSLSPSNPVKTYEGTTADANGEINWQQWTIQAIFDPLMRSVEFQSVARHISEQQLIERRAELKHLSEDIEKKSSELKQIKEELQNIYSVLAVIAQDITERKQIEQSLQEKTQQLQAIIEMTGEGITLSDAAGCFEIFNTTMQKITGYTIAEANNSSDFIRLLHPEEQEFREAQERLEQVREKGKISDIKTTIFTKNKIRKSLLISTSVVRCKNRDMFLSAYRELSENQQIESALCSNEEYFRHFLENSPIGMIICDRKSRIISVNTIVCKMLGYTESEMLSLNIADINKPEILEKNRILNEQNLLKKLPIYQVEKCFIKKNKESVWVNVVVKLIRDQKGETLYGFGIVEDITDRKLLEAIIQESEDRFCAIFEQSAVGMSALTLDDKFFRINQKLCDILGYTHAEMLSLNFQDITHPDDIATDIIYKQRLLCGEISNYSIEKRCITKQGVLVWGKMSLSAVCNRTGQPHYLIVAVEDISDRKQAEVALQESEAKYRALMNDAGDAIMLVDMQGNILEANTNAEELLGYQKGELVKMHASQIHPLPERKRVMTEFMKSIKKGVAWLPNTLVLQKGGQTVWVDINSRVVEWGGGDKVMQTIFRDITYRVQLENTLKQQAERERLVRGIAQNIRESLNLEEILNTTVNKVREFLQTERVIIHRFNASGSGQIVAESIAPGWGSTLDWAISNPWITNNQLLDSHQLRQICAIEDIYKSGLEQCHIQLLETSEIRAVLVMPILTGEYPSLLWGLLIAHQCSGVRKWQQLEINLLQELAMQLALGIQQSQLYQQLKEANVELHQLATVDCLTQIANRRRFDEYLHQEWWRLTHEQKPLSLILCDIDFFKLYNDACGHQAGDRCLKQVADAIRPVLKHSADLVARYGGEEFAIILPNTDATIAIDIAQTIRSAVKDLRIVHKGLAPDRYVTLSLGTATVIPGTQFSPERLIAAADRALYCAKEQGRDRVWSNEC